MFLKINKSFKGGVLAFWFSHQCHLNHEEF